MLFSPGIRLVGPLLATVRFAMSQTIQAQCGDAARSSVLPDNVFQVADVAGKVLPTLRDVICPFDPNGYCYHFTTTCLFTTSLSTGPDTFVSITVNMTEEINAGESGSYAPCPRVLDQIFEQCITSSSPKSYGSARESKVFYSIEFESGQYVNPGQITSDDLQVDFKATLPQELHSILDAPSTEPTQAPDPPQPPQPPQTPQCEQDCLAMRDRIKAKGDGEGWICTNEENNFVETGSSDHDESDFFLIEKESNCNIVMAKSADSRGHFSYYCIHRDDMVSFVDRAAKSCNADPFAVQVQNDPLPAQRPGSGVGMLCLSDGNNYKKCGAGIV